MKDWAGKNTRSEQGESAATGIDIRGAFIKDGETGHYDVSFAKKLLVESRGETVGKAIGIEVDSIENRALEVTAGTVDITAAAYATASGGLAASTGQIAYSDDLLTVKGGTIDLQSDSTKIAVTTGVHARLGGTINTGTTDIKTYARTTERSSSTEAQGLAAGEYNSQDGKYYPGHIVVTSDKITVRATAQADNRANYFRSFAARASEGTLVLNNAELVARTVSDVPDNVWSGNLAYGVLLEGNSTFKMKDGSIDAAATDLAGTTMVGYARGLRTISESGGPRKTVEIGNVNIRADGTDARAVESIYADMTMSGGSLEAVAHGNENKTAAGLRALKTSTFAATGALDITAKAVTDSAAVGVEATGENVTVSLAGGSVTAQSEGLGHAKGLEATSGGAITKTSGDITVTSGGGLATGIRVLDNKDGLPGSKVAFGSEESRSSLKVEGGDYTWGVFAKNWDVATSDGEVATAVITNTDISAAAKDSSDMVLAVYTSSGAVNLKGSSVSVSAPQSTSQVYAMYAETENGKGVISSTDTTGITGDIGAVTSDAEISVAFADGAAFRGWTRSAGDPAEEFSGAIDLSMGAGTTWEMISSNDPVQADDGRYVATVSSLDINGAHVYVGNTAAGWKASPAFAAASARMAPTDAPAELEVKTLSGSGNFYLRTDLDKDISDSVLVTESLSGTHGLHVKASGVEPVEVQTASYLARAEAAVGADPAAFNLANGTDNKIDLGTYTYKLMTSERNGGQEWYLQRTKELSPTAEAEAALSGFAAQYALWYGIQSDLRKRLGEVRYGTRTGLWGRAFADKSHLEGLGGTTFRQKVYGAGIGYDTIADEDEDTMWIVGGQIRFGRGTQDIGDRADGNLRSVGGVLYATWVDKEEGWYSDLVASIDRFRQKINATMLDGTAVYDNHKTYGLGLSIEVGRKMNFRYSNEGRDYWFAEPQLQLSYFWLKGGHYRASNGMEIDQHGMDSLNGRAGIVLGKKFSTEGGNGQRYWQPYVKAGVNHEFLGDQVAYINGFRMSSDIGTRFYYGLGVDWQARDDLRFYMQAEREHGHHFTRDYNISAGLKWEF